MKPIERALLACFAILAAACTPEPSQPLSGKSALGSGTVATVNGEAIPESVFRLYALSGLQKDPDHLTDQERDAVVEDLVRLTLLSAEARKKGLLDERRIAAQLELQRLQQVARVMAVRYLEENPATEAELQQAYELNLPRLSGRQYKARHILSDTEDGAQAVIEELDKGADFGALARERSTGPTGPNGGDLGWFTADSMVQPFADAVSAMDVGTYSAQPVQTSFGFHVIMLEDTRDQEPPGMDTVRADLKNAVDRDKLDAYVTSLREAAVVNVSDNRSPE